MNHKREKEEKRKRNYRFLKRLGKAPARVNTQPIKKKKKKLRLTKLIKEKR